MYVSPGGRGHVPLTENTTRTVAGAAADTSSGGTTTAEDTSGADTHGAMIPIVSASGDTVSGELAPGAAVATRVEGSAAMSSHVMSNSPDDIVHDPQNADFLGN